MDLKFNISNARTASEMDKQQAGFLKVKVSKSFSTKRSGDPHSISKKVGVAYYNRH